MRSFRALALIVVLALTTPPAGAEHCRPAADAAPISPTGMCPEQPATPDVPLDLAGHAYAAAADLTLAGAGVGIPKVSPVTLPPSGGGPRTAAMVAHSVPPVLQLEGFATSTEGTRDGYVLSTAQAERVALDLGSVRIHATGVRAVASCSSAGPGDVGPAGVAPSAIGSLSIDGEPVDTDVAPNTWIPLPGIGGVMLREQWDRSDTSSEYQAFTEHMIHVYLWDGPVTGEVIVSSAHCDGLRLTGEKPPLQAG